MTADASALVDGMIHPETQLHDGFVDLTVSAVHHIDAPAHLDFGGSELQRPATTAADPEPRNPTDEYGWWSLSPGTYLIEYNEDLQASMAYLQPRDALIHGGGMHSSGWVRELTTVGLTVGAGLELKENARISTLVHPGRIARETP